MTTPRIVTSGGSIVWQWRNDNPYGNNLAQGTIEFNLRFAGQYYDSESGLHYNIHRTYNPEIGRYMQSDPLGLSAGSNTYNYVGRNPFDGVDPLGLIEGKTLNFTSPYGGVNKPLNDFAKYANKNAPINTVVAINHGLSKEEGRMAIINMDSPAILELQKIDNKTYDILKNLTPCKNSLCDINSREIDGIFLGYIIKKLANNKEYTSLFLTQCNGQDMLNLNQMKNIVGMNVWYSTDYTYIGIINNHSEPLGTISMDDYLKIKDLNSEQQRENYYKMPSSKPGLKGFIELK